MTRTLLVWTLLATLPLTLLAACSETTHMFDGDRDTTRSRSYIQDDKGNQKPSSQLGDNAIRQ